MKRCVHCGELIQEQDNYCRYCGKEQTMNNSSHCQSCGLPVQTKYVEFYENVGMLVIRKHRSIKGEICKNCIDKYFWDLTGKTMVLGWWGFFSLIVTPFILLNNIFRYLFTLGMEKPPVSLTPSPSPFWVFATIGGVLFFGYMILSILSSI